MGNQMDIHEWLRVYRPIFRTEFQKKMQNIFKSFEITLEFLLKVRNLFKKTSIVKIYFSSVSIHTLNFAEIIK